MSIILDALRRAEADRERGRGTVPGLYDQPELSAHRSGAAAGPPAPRRGLPLALFGVVALAAVALAFWWGRRAAMVPPPAAAMATGVASAEAPGVPDRPTVPAAALAPRPDTAPASSAAAWPASAAHPGAAVRPPRPMPAARIDPDTARAAPARKAGPAQASGVAVSDRGEAPARRATAPTPRLQDLPADLQRQIPPLKLGGSMYSESPTASVLVINDQVLREGDTVAPGLVLERIGPTSARLRWHAQAFELPYPRP